MWSTFKRSQPNDLSQYFEMLERTQYRALMKFQNLPYRTHNCIARGLLGQLSVLSQINIKKLLFLERMIALNSDCIVKQVFIKRLYASMCDDSVGYIFDIDVLLCIYELKIYLIRYIQGSRFPSKREWKVMVKHAVIQRDHDTCTCMSKNELTIKPEGDL